MAKMDIRWAQLDVARQMETVEFIEKFVTLLADSGYNGLLLYLEDRIKTASYQLPADNEVYTVDEIKHIVAYAAERGVEVVPCVATLGHAERFLREINSAAVYVNASTRFTDGGEFGFGAEIGISTQKLHVRGPMGLSALTTEKYLIRGEGAVR